MSHKTFSHQQGFTIIELMLATAVFSLILLLCTASLIQIGRMYYKGVTSAQTQEAARTVIDQISRPLQFSGDEPQFGGMPGPGSVQSFCLGTQRFTYVIDRQLNDSPDPALLQSHHVLWRDTMTDNVCVPIAGFTSSTPGAGDPTTTGDGVELLSPNMRLSRLTVAQLSGEQLYQVEAWVVYGDEDLLERLAGPPARITCLGNVIGAHFCAVSELSTVVTRRLR